MICKCKGMFSTGNKNPLNKSEGRNKLIMDVNWAVCWVLAELEINIPSEREVIVNRMLSPTNKNKLPRTGTSRTYTLSKSMVAMFSIETSRYGMVLAMIILKGFNGETRRTSMVPISFSLTMEIEVIMAQTSINTRAI